uniref:Uncharacterized protein n=1 Tax=Heterorhabditis bacteriophora TaxID=37862 RepID=A0A1I7WP01_HETBA
MVSFGALGRGPLSRGLCLSAIKGRGFASELFSHIPFVGEWDIFGRF